jgi:hypothetical protein
MEDIPNILVRVVEMHYKRGTSIDKIKEYTKLPKTKIKKIIDSLS